MLPTPVQAAAQAALEDDAHVMAQRSRYARRRELLREALDGAGFQVSSEAGLYLWCTRGSPRCVRWTGSPSGGSSSARAPSTAMPVSTTSGSR